MSADRRTRPQLLADIADLRAQLARVSASYAGRDCVVAADPLPASDTDEGSGQLTAIDIP
jgi:hypothetical protein